MKLNLGAGRDIRNGYLNVDCVSLPGIDEVMNIDKAWPWASDVFSEVLCLDVLEHGRDKMHLMEELFRVSEHGAEIRIEMPNFRENPVAWGDPTHRLPWDPENIEFFCPNHPWNYYTTARFLVTAKSISHDRIVWVLRTYKKEDLFLYTQHSCSCPGCPRAHVTARPKLIEGNFI